MPFSTGEISAKYATHGQAECYIIGVVADHVSANEGSVLLFVV